MKFTRQNSHGKKRLGAGYRRPKGLQSKQRLRKKGHIVVPSTGYGVSAKDRKKAIIVNSLSDLTLVDAKSKAEIFIAGGIGLRKQKQLLESAEKAGIIFKNLNKESLAERLRAQEAERKARKEKELLKKQKHAKAKSDKKEDKSEEMKEGTIEEVVDDKQKKEQEKKEHDKILVTKNV